MIIQHNNAHSYVTNLTKHAIKELSCKVLLHPPYSPDLTPSDYNLFWSLSNNLKGVSFNNDVKLKTWLDEFLEFKT